MKKKMMCVAALLLCLTLAACGSTKAPETTAAPVETTAAPTEPETTVEKIIGTWVCLEDQRIVINGATAAGARVVINEDKTGEMRQGDQSAPFTWEYDEATRTIILYNALDETETETFVYLEVIDAISNDWNGLFARENAQNN